MSFVNYLTIATFFATLAVVFVVRGRKPVTNTAAIFAWFSFVVSLWILSNFLVDVSPLFKWDSLLLAKFTLFGAALIPPLMFLFAQYFSKKEVKKFTLVILFLPVVLFFLILPTEYNIRSVNYFDGVVGIEPGIGYYALLAHFLILCGLAVRTLFIRHRLSRGIEREQLKYMLLGFTITTLLGLVFDAFLPLLGINSLVTLGPVSTVFFIGFTTYAIIAHQLFDIRIIIKRTLVYSGLLLFALGTYSAIIFFFTQLFGGENTLDTKTFLANLVAATLIALGFEPIKQTLTKATDKYLFKGQYDPQKVLGALSEKLSASVDIRQATESLVTLIKEELRLTHTAVIIFKLDDAKVVVKEAIEDGYKDPNVLQLRSENLLLQQFARAPIVLITDLLRRECEAKDPGDPYAQTCQMLLVDLGKLEVALAIPILVDNKAIGIFFVGEKLSGDMFARSEIDFLKIVANQTANAIEKARFWEEDQLKSEFVSIASHELLTPTAAIKGYLSMILDDGMGQIDDRARIYLEKVYHSSDRLAKLVEDLLNVSRIESGRLKINKRDFSFAESVQRATDELQVNAKNKSLDLAFVPPPTPLATVFADPDHVYRVLVNLIGNSIKYTEQGWVRCFVTQFDPQHLLFAVSDSGLGIPKDSIPHLFEKFYRADRKEIAGIQGTGLGLYISKKIIELMGGQLWVQSEVGKGSTFYFTLPISSAPLTSQQATPTAERSALPAPSQTPTAVVAPATSGSG